MSIRIASHLFRNRHGTFYFRLVVPKDLREYINQREIRFSLQTEQRQQAIASALSLVANLPKHIFELRRMAENSDNPITDSHHAQWIEQLRQNLNLKAQIVDLEDRLAEAEFKLSKSTPLERANAVVERAYDKGQLKGKRELEERLAFPWLPERTVPFSELQAAYMKSLTVRATGGTKKPPNPKTMEEYAKSIEFFITVMGDLRIGEIDREIAGDYFSTLKKLPANLTRLSKYRGKSISELIAMGDSPQSEVNISKKIERISTMFKWALEEKRKWGIDANPFTGFGQADNTETKRRPFTNDELRVLLTHPDYIKRKFTNSYAFWLIPLALFTGARLGELCQLDIKDFVEVEGIACIDINDVDATEIVVDSGRKKRVKNKNARRLVPLHSALIDIGLLRYVDKLKGQGQKHLFPELSRERRDGPGHAASNWFQGFRKRVGLTEKQETVFHSFRHYFITNILDNEVPPHMLAPIVGHEAELITGKVYWNTKDATKRKPTVDKFKVPDDVMVLLPAIEDLTFTVSRKVRSKK